MMTDEARPKYNELRSMFLPQGETDWRKVFSVCFPKAELNPPASSVQIDAAANALGRNLPDDLISFHLVSDGIEIESVNLISPLAEIVDNNRDYRANGARLDCMPFDHMLFFGSELNGDMFAFPISQQGEYTGSIFLWSHETDCREFFAYSLLDFIIRYRAYSGES